MNGSKRQIAARSMLLVLCAGALTGVLPIAYRHAMGITPCPTVGLFPACYAVSIGYLLVVLSIFSPQRLRNKLFVIGWIPLIGFAVLGSVLEVLGHDACPRSLGNTPACFISLALGVTIVVLFVFGRGDVAGHSERQGSNDV